MNKYIKFFNPLAWMLCFALGLLAWTSCSKYEHGLEGVRLSINSAPDTITFGSNFNVKLITNNVSNFTLSLVPEGGGTSVFDTLVQVDKVNAIVDVSIGVPANGDWNGAFLLRASYDGGQTEQTKQIFFREGDPVFYIVGGSISSGWEPDLALPMRVYSDDKNAFEIYVYMDAADGGFKFLPTQDGWDGGLGKDESADGKIVDDGGAPNLEVATSGFYHVRMNKQALTYTAVLSNWGVIGDATGSWDNSTAMDFDGGKGSYTWTKTMNLSVGEFKFRANDSWDINLGGDMSDLAYDGANIAITSAGNYTITLNLKPEGGYVTTLAKN
ncbi:SusF/SusE family outer membrane protein [Olivibacter sitiensis]|uniref:SusF/SusE family outer membrane protein n=1 Tax=Olivibacter sitiensis TaxID=376470 RepID=UPI000428A1D8|nr:SusF/SusE family outer membrane protein [Olivibacter sitiensis]